MNLWNKVSREKKVTNVLEPSAGQICTTWVPEEHAGWYVKWCRNFAKSRKGPLNQRSGRDVLQFIERQTVSRVASCKLDIEQARTQRKKPGCHYVFHNNIRASVRFF